MRISCARFRLHRLRDRRLPGKTDCTGYPEFRQQQGDFCPERVRRLVELIDAETTKPIAVFTHHPPFEVLVGPDRFHFETTETVSRLRQALQHSGRVVAVFSGHVHRAAAGYVGSIPATVVQCIATTLRKGEYPPY